MTNPVTKGKAREWHVGIDQYGEIRWTSLDERFVPFSTERANCAERIKVIELTPEIQRKLETHEELVTELSTLKAQNEKLIKALSFYADRKNWFRDAFNKDSSLQQDFFATVRYVDIDEDEFGGKLARQVLKELGENK